MFTEETPAPDNLLTLPAAQHTLGHRRPPDQKTLVGAGDYRKGPAAVRELVKPWLSAKKPRFRTKGRLIETQDVRFKKLLAVLALACTRGGCYTAFRLSCQDMNDILDSWHSSKHNAKPGKDGDEVSVYGIPFKLSGEQYAEFRTLALEGGWLTTVANYCTINEDGFSLKGVYAWQDPEVIAALLTTVDSRYRSEFVQKSSDSALKAWQVEHQIATATLKNRSKILANLDVTDWISTKFTTSYLYQDGACKEQRSLSASDLAKFDRKLHSDIKRQIKTQVVGWVRNFLTLLNTSGTTLDMHRFTALPEVTIRLTEDQLRILGTSEVKVLGFLSLETLLAAVDARAKEMEKVRPQVFSWDLWREIGDCWRQKLAAFGTETYQLTR